jgi:hypothetical protein
MPPAERTYEILGAPSEDPVLRLDHERFAYAGKFVMTSTGKAVARENGAVVAAVAFNRDRTDESVAWLRYLTVRADRQCEGIAPRLARLTAGHLHEAGAERVAIAVNNPYAFVACYRAGFEYAGRETGIAEVVLERREPAPTESNPERERHFRAGLETLLEAADRPVDQREYGRKRLSTGPPAPIDTDELTLAATDPPDRASPHD